MSFITYFLLSEEKSKLVAGFVGGIAFFALVLTLLVTLTILFCVIQRKNLKWNSPGITNYVLYIIYIYYNYYTHKYIHTHICNYILHMFP